MVRGLLLLTALGGLTFAGHAQPPRDAAKTPDVKGATIRGKVVAAATGLPLHRVRLTLAGGADNAPTGVTDTRGQFEITDVPPGSYSVSAARAGYLPIQYGQRRPGEAGRRIEVEAAQTLEGLEVYMFLGGVLAGRIIDEAGDPYPGARVEAVGFRYIRGRRLPVTARITTTNDAGEYRLSSLDPGPYQIRAASTDIWDDDDGKATYTYAVTWFPGVSRGDAPQTVDVGVGEEVGALDFRLVAGRAARITGVVESAAGAPLAGQVVHLSRLTRTTGNALLSSGGAGTTKSDDAGRFEFARLAAGEYMASAGGADDRSSATVFLDEGGLEHVVLTPRKPAALAGTIVTDDGSTPEFPSARIRVAAIGTDARSAMPMWGAPSPASPRADWTFRLANADGPYLLRVTGLPDEWMLKAVRVRGRDVTDEPLTVTPGAPDVDGIEVVLSRRGATVSGTVVNADATPTADATVVLFAEDRARWGIASRFVHALRPDDRGRIRFTGLPPGAYRIAARDVVFDGQWEDPAFLEVLSSGAARVELKEGEEAAVNVRLEPAR